MNKSDQIKFLHYLRSVSDHSEKCLESMPQLKLFMLLIGSKAPGRHVEQHDFFFGIAASVKELVPEIRAFWPEAGEKIHVDAWREVTAVDDYAVRVAQLESPFVTQNKKLFFINLGGYQENKFEEQHYTLLTVKDDYTAALREAKATLFFKNNQFQGAWSHIDDKYGIDVDELYQVEDILSPSQKDKYSIELTPAVNLKEDVIHLGYFKLDKL